MFMEFLLSGLVANYFMCYNSIAMKYFKFKEGTSHIELLLALAILSISLYPLAYVLHISMPPRVHSDDEYMATLLAHHVMETIVAKRAKDPSYLPNMRESKPIVFTTGSNEGVSEYFEKITAFNGPITKEEDPELFRAVSRFRCNLDTYFLDENMFKVIVYVTYEKEGREMKVFFERLLPQYIPEIDDIEDGF